MHLHSQRSDSYVERRPYLLLVSFSFSDTSRRGNMFFYKFNGLSKHKNNFNPKKKERKKTKKKESVWILLDVNYKNERIIY